MTNLSLSQLRQAVSIKERIDGLQTELNRLLGSAAAAVPAYRAITPGSRGRKRSAAVRARMAAAQQARWAKKRQRTGSITGVTRKTKKRHFSPEALARISAAAKARWAKARAAGKRMLG